MRTIFVLFDSLNRRALEAYGGDMVPTPNFNRFAQRAVVFDHHYSGSLPCIPARRDLHTGRLNFLHRSWGPLEPFDDSFPKILSENGVYTHLVTDHAHYFEDGGCCYATAYDSWDFIRGQENDPVKAVVEPAWDQLRQRFDERQYPFPKAKNGRAATSRNNDRNTWARSRGAVNSLFTQDECDTPIAKCFASALDFLDLNKSADNWFLQLECFDPHEPFAVPERFRALTGAGSTNKVMNWPLYEKVTESETEIKEIKANYAALVAMCDAYFGKLLDWMDENEAWDDTAIVMTTDHGFLLGEHEWWAKSRTPYYQEIAHIPLMVWNPEEQNRGYRSQELTQTTDLMPTFLSLHDVPVPHDVVAHDLTPGLTGGATGRQSAILGMFGGPICVTDKHYSYFCFPENPKNGTPSLYTLMPTHMAAPFSAEELKTATMVEPFNFTKGLPLMRVEPSNGNAQGGFDILNNWTEGSVLYDLFQDPGQNAPIKDGPTIERLTQAICSQMKAHDAPAELYKYYGLRPDWEEETDASNHPENTLE